MTTDKKSIRDLLSLTVTTYKAFGRDFTETKLFLRVEPSLVIQMLAWDGVAHLHDGNVIHVTDWNQLSKDAIWELKNTLFTTYPGIISGKNKRNRDGSYELTGISTTATVEDGGMITLPDHDQVLKNRRDLKVRQLI